MLEPATTRAKVLIAATGSPMPIVANLVVVDLTPLFQKLTLLALLAYAIRTAVYFSTGCLMGYLRRAERDLMTLFFVGMSVPSFLVGLVNQAEAAKRAETGAPPSATAPSSPQKKASLFSLPTVHADSTPKDTGVKVFSLPQETAIQQILRGFGITPSYRGYFVIAAAYINKDDADKAADILRQRGFTPAVHAPVRRILVATGEVEVYSVVIGEQKTKEEALEIQNAAKRAGLQTAFVWR